MQNSGWEIVEDIPASAGAEPWAVLEDSPAAGTAGEGDVVSDSSAPDDGQEGPITRAVKRFAATSPKHAAAVGIGETVAQVVTGLPAAAVGTVGAGVDLALGRGADKALETFHTAAEGGTYQPRTEMGKKLSGAMAWPFEKAEELGAKAGEAVHEATKDPRAATVVHTAVAGVPYAVGYALGARGRRGAEEGESAARFVTDEEIATGVARTQTVDEAIVAAKTAAELPGPETVPKAARVAERPAGEQTPWAAVMPDEPIQGARSVGAMEAEAITPNTRLGEALDSMSESLQRAGKEAADLTGAKSISYLDDLTKVSPTARKLRDTIEYTEFSREPVPPSFYERVSLKTGEYMGRLESALDSLRGIFRRRLPEKVNEALVASLRGEKPAKPVPGVNDVALRIRSLLNGVRDYAREQGLEVGFIPNYFPRVYKQKVLESDAGRTAFIKVLQKHGIEATEADTIAARIVNHDGILVMERAASSERINPAKPHESHPYPLERMLKAKARANKNIETARKLTRVPDAELAPFLENNVPAVLSRYVTGVIRRAEYARAFGAGEGKLNRMVRDIITEAAQAGRPVRPAEIQRIYDLADAMQQKYRPIMSGTGRAANNFLISYQYLRTLPLATISSLSEPFIVLSRGRPSVIPQAIARSLSHAIHETVRSVYRKFPKAEATKALEDVGLGLDAALSERLTASFGGEVTKFTTAFFKLNFLHQFTRFNRVLGNETGKLMVERHLKDLKRGVPERRASQLRRELAELGVDTDKGLSWIERGAKPNDPFYETVKAAGLRFTNEVVMNPRPTNRPMWQSNPHFHLLAQLKGFQTVFGNTVLPRWYDMIAKRGAYEGTKNAAKIATAGVLMTYTAMLGNDLREVIKHGPGGNPKFKDEDPTKTVYRAMERAGFLGVFQFASDAMFAHRFGSPALAQLMGPQASQVNELIEGTGQAMEGKPRALARGVVNAIPGANVIPSVRKELTNTIAGEPERRRRGKP